jgi:hypothetical protein
MFFHFAPNNDFAIRCMLWLDEMHENNGKPFQYYGMPYRVQCIMCCKSGSAVIYEIRSIAARNKRETRKVAPRCDVYKHTSSRNVCASLKNLFFISYIVFFWQPPILSRATLIISPVTIAHQWVEEITRHTTPSALRLLVSTSWLPDWTILDI